MMDDRIYADAVPIKPRIPPLRLQPEDSQDSRESTPEVDDTPPSSPSPPPPDKVFSPNRAPRITINHSKYIHVGNTVVYNMSRTIINKTISMPKTSPEPKRRIERTPSIDLIISSNDEVSHKYMEVISRNLGEGWKDFFRSVGYKDGFIETFIETYKQDGISEVIYQLLLDWVRNPEDDKNRTIGELCKLLWDAGKCELVQQLIDVCKASKNQKKS